MKVIAHRGGAGLRVENTLAAFANAIDVGAEGAELDVHLSRDGCVVVHHDERLNPDYCRHVGGDWLDPGEAPELSALTCAELQAYDIGTPRPGSDYARRFDRIQPVPDQHIPPLREAIRLVQSRSDRFTLVVEIKTPLLAAADRPWVELVDATLAVIEAEDFFGRAILCSFDWGALRYARKCRPDIATWFTSSPASWFDVRQPPPADIPPGDDELRRLRGCWAGGYAPWYAGFDPRRFGGSEARAVAAAGGAAWFPFHRDFTRESAAELAAAGLDGAVWSVNLREKAELARLARTGVGSVVVDYPDLAIAAARADV